MTSGVWDHKFSLDNGGSDAYYTGCNRLPQPVFGGVGEQG